METAIPVSKRSITGYGAMAAVMKLSGSDSEYAFHAMIVITILAVAYMVADELKHRRKA